MDTGGNYVARYASTDGVDEVLAEFRSGVASFYEQDDLGSVTSLTNLSGAISQTYSYDAFGSLKGSAGGLTNFLQYTGRDYDSETSLYYYRSRYYDASIGRFLSEDPVQFSGGANFFAYVGNNPTDFTDWLGLYRHKPGGPYHAPGKSACRATGPLKDSCPSIEVKIYDLGRSIASHGAFQLAGQDHTRDIADLMVQLRWCMYLYEKNCKENNKECKKKAKPESSPEPQTNPAPTLTPTQTITFGAILGTAAAIAEEYGWLVLAF